MKIDKITEKYQLYKDGASYVIDFGETKRAEDKTVEIEITAIEEAGLLKLSETCGCVSVQKTLYDSNRAGFKINYSNCDSPFNQTVVVFYNNKQLTTILLTGRCSQ